MTSRLNSRTSPPPKNPKPLRRSRISKYPYVTCHIVCQPRSLPPWHRPPLHKGTPNHLQLPAPPLQGREKKGPMYHPHLAHRWLTTLNTTYHSTIRGLARRSVTPRSTPGSTHTHTKLGNTGGGHIMWPPAPQATSTVTSAPPPLTRKLPPAEARAAIAKAKLRSLLPPNLLRVRQRLQLQRGRPPFQVPNDASLLLASPLPLTQKLSPLPLPFLTSPLASCENRTAYSPFGFSATVNPRGSVSLTVSDKGTPAASYAPSCNSLTRALNQSFPVGENPWCTLVLAPTAVHLAIHGLPLRFLPQEEEELFPYIRQAIPNDKATQVLSTRYLNPSRDSRETKQATSVVMTVDPQNVSALTSGVVILSQKCKVELAFSSSRTSQCKNCWRYRHAHQPCPATHPTCPICVLHHSRAAHRCQNPTCPRSGNNKPVTSWGPTSPPHCCNCGGEHTATFRECPAQPPPPVPTRTSSPAPARIGQDPMDLAVDGGPTPTTPPTGTGPLEVNLVTPRQPPPA